MEPPTRVLVPQDGRLQALTLAAQDARTLHRPTQRCGSGVVDTATSAVLTACANTPREGQSGTWIVPELQTAYLDWAAARGAVCTASRPGWAASCRRALRRQSGAHVLWRVHVPPPHRRLQDRAVCLDLPVPEFDIPWIDCQQNTRHLASFGAAEVPREAFEAHGRACPGSSPQRWSYDSRLWHTGC